MAGENLHTASWREGDEKIGWSIETFCPAFRKNYPKVRSTVIRVTW